MVNGIKVTENAGGSERTTNEHRKTAFFFYRKRNLVTNQDTGGEDRSYQITEKALFHRRQIAGETDKEAHKSKANSGQKDEQDTFYIIVIVCFSHIYHTFYIISRCQYTTAVIFRQYPDEEIKIYIF